MNNLFITGTYRSGTTLVEKLMHNHPECLIASQPFPFLYFKIKERFNVAQRIQNFPYPINDNLADNYYEIEEFLTFLERTKYEANEINTWLSEMEGFKGCQTPEIKNFKSKGGTFIEISKELNEFFTEIYNEKSSVNCVGSKEIVAEDYIPYLLQKGAKIILVIRDPRDIVASANYSKKKSYVGKNRPALYTLRLWRKSIAYALNYSESPNLYVLKYEDLVTYPEDTLKKVTSFLNISPFPEQFLKNGIRDQNGHVWASNSSFENKNIIDSSSIGRHVDILPANTINYIEQVCYPEMVLMNYRSKKSTTIDLNLISNHKEELQNLHPAFLGSTYLSDVENKIELKRMKDLIDPVNESEENGGKLFLTNKLRSVLRQVFKQSYEV